jgi:hypothetical protein
MLFIGTTPLNLRKFLGKQPPVVLALGAGVLSFLGYLAPQVFAHNHCAQFGALFYRC